MSLAQVSIKRPIFMTCVMIAIIVAGITGFKTMSVDLFPDVSIPVVTVQTTYSGAGPAEIENLVSRPLEDEMSSISGIKRMKSRNLEGYSLIIVEFLDHVNPREAEQQVRDKVNIAIPKLPDDIDDPVIKKFDPADSPILMIGLSAEGIGEAKLFDIADQFVKPRFEQVNNVGAIDIWGGREREIHVLLDRKKLEERELSVTAVSDKVGASGQNIPSGKVDRGEQELVFRGLGEFEEVSEVKDTIVSLYGNEVATRVADVGIVVDTLEDEQSRAFLKGNRMIVLQVFRQAGSNTLEVARDVKKQMEKIAPDLAALEGSPQLKLLVDSSTQIEDNVFDVYETIIIGIILTIITVFFFLGSMRSTLITALSLPISLIGAFVLLYLANFSINIVSLLALVLAVGLLIDDAIVVIENIYRFMEEGHDAKSAAQKGTEEIQMAVLAITLVVMAVFVPVAMMSGTIGQYLKQFGLTVAFSMAISMFVALTIIPMLAAYFGGKGHGAHVAYNPHSIYEQTLGRLVRGFDRFQTWLENIYEKFLKVTLRHELLTIGATLAFLVFSVYLVKFIPGEFIPDDDSGEINVTFEVAIGSNLDTTNKMASELQEVILKNKEVDFVLMFVGSQYGEANKGSLFIKLKKDRGGLKSEKFRENLRDQLAPYKESANPIISAYGGGGGGEGQPLQLNLMSANPEALEQAANKLVALMKADKRLTDVDTNYRTGKPELQIKLKRGAAQEYGVSTRTMGNELRSQVEGFTPAKFREMGREYDVRVRLQEDQRDLKDNYEKIFIPNVNDKLVRLTDIADATMTTGPATIERMNRSRYILLSAGTAPGAGMNEVIADLVKAMGEGDTKLPADVRYNFAGDAEHMQELITSTIVAVVFGLLVIYLILSSLYESFITPITIMVSLPLSISGAFIGLLLTGKSLNFFTVLGFFMLIGVAGKNGILLVDFARQLMDEGMDRVSALVKAGKTRLRPILMTSFALVAGTMPIAIGLNPASKTRTSMGVAIVAGVLLSTVLTLIVVPAVFTYVDRFRVWAVRFGSRFTSQGEAETVPAIPADENDESSKQGELQ
jgi:HAE1 family hydrophobic/amphiphilic exporter-1